ncbi:hypothetical protein K491DRAFT_614136 [Lophiostoma macrostomum CBS 122681]|uniref:Rhodopsin domain-containing protein n=1 Tax=Lophiostoma macrostomum CBS 122681 TaxID=1314788 RepID=A0A6A6SM70_9PLEO|nr:hypothetical protein K491DRAFT_614136 [Lophiostoma macrostomum CBS 122681]
MAPEDYSDIIRVVLWAQLAIAIICVTLRIYASCFVTRNLGWDDAMMLAHLFTFVGYAVCINIGVTYGIGKKAAQVPPVDYANAVIWEAIGLGICFIGIAASKASVALFLLRIVILKWHRALLWFCILSTTVLCVTTTVLFYMQCRLVAVLWDRKIQGGICWLDFTPIGLTMGAWSAAMDFFLALLPCHVIMTLAMKRKRRFTINFCLSLGIFAGICSIIWTCSLQTLSSSNEYIYDTAEMLIWSSTKICVTILCACVPGLRSLFVTLRYGGRSIRCDLQHIDPPGDSSRRLNCT